jgi:hypothetical protein
LDRYLGWTGYGSQQTDEADRHDRPFNLWEPVSGDLGAHGRFDRRAHRRSLQLVLATHRRSVAAAGIAAAAGLLGRRRR